MREHIRQKPRAHLEAVDFSEVCVGPNRSEMNDLVEAWFEARCFCVEEDEAQRICPSY